MSSESSGAYVPTHTQYNNFPVIYTVVQLIKMGRIRIPGPDSFERRRREFEFPNTILMNGISEFSFEIHNKDVQNPSLTCFPIYYKKISIIKNKEVLNFYILEDLVKDKIDEYGYLKDKDNTIIDMLKKYRYIMEDEK